jgi:DNA-binding NarL/FixJ family response regulator
MEDVEHTFLIESRGVMSTHHFIRVVIVDDHPEVRRTLISILKSHSDVQVVGEASTGVEAIARAEELQPTVILMDINIPALDGIAATRVITSKFPEIAIIGLSGTVQDYLLYAIVKAGGFGLFQKDEAVGKLYDFIRRAIASKQPRQEDERTTRSPQDKPFNPENGEGSISSEY